MPGPASPPQEPVSVNGVIASDANLSVSDITTNNASTSAHGFMPKGDNNTAHFYRGDVTQAAVTDANLSISDVTTNNVSTSAHGFAPKAPNDAGKFLDGTGAYTSNWWVELGRTTIAVAATSMTVAAFTSMKYLRVYVFGIPTAGNIDFFLRLGNGSLDTGSNYSQRFSTNGGADTTNTSTSSVQVSAQSNVALEMYSYIDIVNYSSQEKLIVWNGLTQGTAGATTAPNRGTGTGKWTNTSAQANYVGVLTGSGGKYDVGSEIVVLGHN